MATVTKHEPGTFCWPELYTPDQAGAKTFYSKLFGWSVRDLPMGPDAIYTIFGQDGRDAAACYGAVPDMEKLKIPPHWMVYVSVASADGAAKKVREAGGDVVKEPFDVMGIGRMAALRDPTGAAFCVWESRGHIGIGVQQEPGALQWTELLTNDVEKAGSFYAKVFDWKRERWPAPEQTVYHLFMRGAEMAGGMTPITPEMTATRPAWVSYFNVESADTTAVRAAGLGGKISIRPETVPDVGRYALLVDPAGAHFGILQPAVVS